MLVLDVCVWLDCNCSDEGPGAVHFVDVFMRLNFDIRLWWFVAGSFLFLRWNIRGHLMAFWLFIACDRVCHVFIGMLVLYFVDCELCSDNRSMPSSLTPTNLPPPAAISPSLGATDGVAALTGPRTGTGAVVRLITRIRSWGRERSCNQSASPSRLVAKWKKLWW